MKEKISYEELETLVQLYQDGHQDAADTLVKRYQGYFQKFINVLIHNKFNIYDRTQRSFVRTFIRDENIRKNANLFGISPYIRRVFYATSINLYLNTRYKGEEDLKQELIILFLTMAKDHNGEAPFSIYQSSYFPLKLHTLVRKWADEDTEKYEIPYDEDMPEAAVYDEYDTDDSESPFYIQTMTPTDYDENWVNGSTAEGIFGDLTPYERRLLKWYYEWRTLDANHLPPDIFKDRKTRLKKTESEIADLLGCSRKTINIKRNDVKRELKWIAEDLHLIKR